MANPHWSPAFSVRLNRKENKEKERNRHSIYLNRNIYIFIAERKIT